MKKITLELTYSELKELGLDYIGADQKELIILDGLKISKDVCVNIWKFSGRIQDPEKLGVIEISMIGGAGEDVYIVKKRPSELTLLLEEYNLYFDFPIHLNQQVVEFSIQGLGQDLTGFLKALDKMRTRYKVKRALDYHTPTDLLEGLTERQKEALELALREGYFSTPRKTNAHLLAEKLGIRHTTFLQHLRRAQERIFERVIYAA